MLSKPWGSRIGHSFNVKVPLLLRNFCQSSGEAELVILSTNDLHSSVIGTALDIEGNAHLGHYARLAFKIKKQKRLAIENKETFFLFDAGDFYSGSLYQSIGPYRSTNPDDEINRRVPELEFFNDLGYHAITLGNHDFESTEGGLCTMLDKAYNQGFKVPIVISNLKPIPVSSSFNAFVSKDPLYVESWFDGFGDYHEVSSASETSKAVVYPYMISKHRRQDGSTFKIGVLGTMGPLSSFSCASHRKHVQFHGFDDMKGKVNPQIYTNKILQEAEMLRNDEQVDAVILITHGGHPEDSHLVRSLPQGTLDLVISGHTHQTYFEHHLQTTFVTQSGCYGTQLGEVRVNVTDKKHLTLVSQQHYLIDNTVPMDEIMEKRISEWSYLLLQSGETNGYAPLDVIYDSSKQSQGKSVLVPHMSKPLIAELIGQAVLEELKKSEHHTEEGYPEYYIFPAGAVRDKFARQENTVIARYQDIFRILSMTGTLPIVHFYLQKPTFWLLKGIGFSLGLITDEASLRFVQDSDYEGDTGNLVHVATNSFLVSYLAKSKQYSWGLIDATPLDAEGNPVIDLTALEYTHGLNESKLVAQYLASKNA